VNDDSVSSEKDGVYLALTIIGMGASGKGAGKGKDDGDSIQIP